MAEAAAKKAETKGLVHTTRPVFIGGSGRSGTSILGGLLATHPDVLYFAEPRFIIDDGGLLDLLDGKTSLEAFRQQMLGPFLEKLVYSLHISGVEERASLYTQESVNGVIDGVLAGREITPAVCAEFLDALFGLAMEATDKSRWVHKTPHTIVHAHRLFEILPDLRYIHIVRDPVNVASSTLEQKWGADSPDAFLKQYNALMHRAIEVHKSAGQQQYMVVHLESLTSEPVDTLDRIFRFCGLDVDEGILERTSTQVKPERAQPLRWEKNLSKQDALRIRAGTKGIYAYWQHAAGWAGADTRQAERSEEDYGKHTMQQTNADNAADQNQARYIVVSSPQHVSIPERELANVLGDDALLLTDKKRELLGQTAQHLREREKRLGLDMNYLDYLQAVEAELDQGHNVVDADTWDPQVVPALHKAFPLDGLVLMGVEGAEAESLRRELDAVPVVAMPETDLNDEAALRKAFLWLRGQQATPGLAAATNDAAVQVPTPDPAGISAAAVEGVVQPPARTTLRLPNAPGIELDVVSVDELHRELGFATPLQYPEASRKKAFADWRMEIDDSPIFRYFYRQLQPQRHLEFGTWQGTGVTYVAEESDATIWTINLLEGESKKNGTGSYGLKGQDRDAAERWARQHNVAPEPGWGYRTDSLGFIGRHYLQQGYGPRVCQIYCDSRDWDISNYPEGFFDTVLIDGGHTNELVTSDTRKALQLVRSGGLVMWHDFCPEMYGKVPTVTGVMDAIAGLHGEMRGDLAKLFWVKPSFILVGVRV